MTTINAFTLDDTFTELTLDVDMAIGHQCTGLKLYIGDTYLTDTFADLTSYVPATEHFLLYFNPTTPEIAALYTKDIFDGAFTIVIETSEGEEFITGRTLINMYYANLCLANKVIAIDNEKKQNEAFMMFFYMQAAITYVTAGLTEQALGAYDRVEAIVKNSPDEFMQTDIAPCGQGTGCWIINGVYVVKY